MTSGQLQVDVKLYIDQYTHLRDDRDEDVLCLFEGTIDASHDPEIDPDSYRWTCPTCRADLEDRP